MGAFAARAGNLQRLDPRLGADARAGQRARSPRWTPRSRPRARFAREILPGVRETAGRRSTRRFPGSRQAQPLLAPAELGGLPSELAPPTPDLAGLTGESQRACCRRRPRQPLHEQGVPADRENQIQDGFATGRENYKEFCTAMVALAGEGQNFDGNGTYVRFRTGGGAQTLRLEQLRQRRQAAAVRQHDPVAAARTRPRYPGTQPPYRTDHAVLPAAGARPQRAGLAAARHRASTRAGRGTAPTPTGAIREHLRDVAAIIGLIAIAVTGRRRWSSWPTSG